MKLVIIEGAGKKETIAKYLKGQDTKYNVFATKGHVRDLPKNTLAVNIKNNFEPKYVIMPDKKDIIKELKEIASKSEEILLATDPDREGEAISWHLAHILEIPPDKKCRIVFNEISQKAVLSALNSPRAIDQNLVDAQQARRVLDRLVGYKLSPLLSKKIRSKLSAGRVQSVALRMVVDREREILAFVPQEYWVLLADLEKDKTTFTAKLKNYQGKKLEIKSKQEMDSILAAIKDAEYKVIKLKKGVTKNHAPAPYTTSTMQQDALNKLGMSLKTTTATAQQLYEGVDINGEKVALVTYIRTDSCRVAPDAMAMAAEFIKKTYGEKYLPESPNYYKSKKGAQDAHEAIRPISLDLTPDSLKNSLSKQAYSLYKMIYDRFVASQMTEAIFDTVSADIEANGYVFGASGRTLNFEGYLAAFGGYKEVSKKDKKEKDDGEEEEESANGILPVLNEGDKINLVELKPSQKFTKPPARYSEATLVKAMEEKGIGRPATYAPIISILFARDYCEKEGRYIRPTELGFVVTDMLIKYFPDIMDIGFTADMETRLDDIEDGGKEWQKVVGDFYVDFEKELTAAMEDSFTLKKPPEETDIVCEKCGSKMVIREGRFGKFLACSAFPKCKNTKPLNDQGEVAQAAEKCEKCGGELVLKTSRYGKFWACSNYPECKNIIPIQNETEDHGTCPLCAKPLVKRRSRMGEFYGCSGYPNCRFISKDRVLDEKCPECNSYLVYKKYKAGDMIKCSSKECGYSRAIEAEEQDGQDNQNDV